MSDRYLVQMHGEPGAGKSTLALEIGRALPAIVIDKDIVSSALVNGGMAPGSSGAAAWEVIWDVARSFIEQGYSVVADGPAGWPIIEQKGKGVARATGAAYRMIECVVEDAEEVSRRLATRKGLPTQPRSRFDWNSRPGAAEPSSDRLVLDGRRPVRDLAREAVAYIRSGEAEPKTGWKRGGGTTKDWAGKLRKGVENRGIWNDQP